MKTYVNTPNKGTLNMRAAPSSSSMVLAQIPYGTALEAEFTSDDWSKVTYNGKTGYVMNKFLGESSTQVTKDELQRIYNSLKSTLQTIENVLK